MHIETNIGAKIETVAVHDFAAERITDAEIDQLRSLVYRKKLLLLKNQDLSPRQYLDLARRFGTPEEYYQPMYHHPEVKEIFVSSNVPKDGVQVGVPRTGRFWHADYSFMPRPFAITIVYPRVIPTRNRGTYFIDMGRAYEALPDGIKTSIRNAWSRHSVQRYFKIRPQDIYRPLGEIIAEVQRETPEVRHPCCFRHPVTGETVLYLNDGFTNRIEDTNGEDLGEQLMHDILAHSGQRDTTFQHPHIHLQTYEPGDIVIWDNRSLVHCALHTDKPEPAESHRITVHDRDAFYEGVASSNSRHS